MSDHQKNRNSKEIQNFQAWQKLCDKNLAKPFLPETSEFPKETLERDNHLTFSKLTNWEIVCQEILNTEYSHVYYQKCYEELLRRDQAAQEIFEMRRFARYTSGWMKPIFSGQSIGYMRKSKSVMKNGVSSRIF